MANGSVDANLYFEQGRQKFGQRDFDSAADLFKRATEVDPKFHDGHRYLAESYEKLGYRHRAKKAWETLLRITSEESQQAEIKRRLNAL